MKIHDNKHLEKILGGELKNLPALHYKNKPFNKPDNIIPNKIYSIEVHEEVFDDHTLIQRFIIGKHKEFEPKPRPITFELSEQETEDAQEWMEEHLKVCSHSYAKGNMPTAGEHYYFKIIPTGLGICTTIGCLYCKDAKKDITDYGSW